MILKTPQGNFERRDVSLGSLMQLNGVPLRGDYTSQASPAEVAGLPAFQQAIRMAALAIAKREFAVWIGAEAQRARVTSTWQARFFAARPNERDTWFFTWESTEASMTARNNAYWLKSHDLVSGRVNRVEVLHPDRVETRWNPQALRAEYRVRLSDGSESDWLTASEVLHFRVGSPSPGAITAPSPVEMHLPALANAVAKQKAESRVYDKGNARTSAIVFPETVTPEQAKRWREVYLEAGGDGNSNIKVFGGGAKVEPIGLTFFEQQFLESLVFSVEDVARILNWPPSLLWSAQPRGGDKPLTPEHEEDRTYRNCIEPRLRRLESFVAADSDFFGPGARAYPEFVSPRPRGDAKTESDMLVHEVQAGILLVDEARAERGLPPLPNGQGQIPQIVPVGGAPNPTPA